MTLLLARKVKLPKYQEIPIISAGGKKQFCCCPWWTVADLGEGPRGPGPPLFVEYLQKIYKKETEMSIQKMANFVFSL